MASGIDYSQAYQKAEKAYMQGKYQDAAAVIDELAAAYPEDPSVLLLRGHIYCYGMQQYEVACEQYQRVLNITSKAEFVDYANNGLDYASQFANGQGADASADLSYEDSEDSQTLFNQGAAFETNASSGTVMGDAETDLGAGFEDFSINAADLLDEDGEGAVAENPFEMTADALGTEGLADLDDPFVSDEGNPFLGDDRLEADFPDLGLDQADNPFSFQEDAETGISDLGDFPENPFEDSASGEEAEDAFASPSMNLAEEFDDDLGRSYSDSTEQTLFMGGDSASPPGVEDDWSADTDRDDMTVFAADPELEEAMLADDEADLTDFSHNGAAPDSLDSEQTGSNVDFLDEFSDFDDLGSLPDFELSDSSAGFTSPAVGPSGLSSTDDDTEQDIGTSAFDLSEMNDQAAISDEDIFSLSGGTESLPVFAPGEAAALEEVSVEQGWLGFLENASLRKKELIVAAAAGIASALAVGVINFAASALQPDRPMPKGLHAAMALVAGATGFGAAWGVGRLSHRPIQHTVEDLQQHFNSVIGGNLTARASVYAEDEFGLLSSSFNQMSRVILTTTSEAQRKAQEQEQAKEDLQRQVIRLLDDV
jgi:twitching motility protein PilJ